MACGLRPAASCEFDQLAVSARRRRDVLEMKGFIREPTSQLVEGISQ